MRRSLPAFASLLLALPSAALAGEDLLTLCRARVAQIDPFQVAIHQVTTSGGETAVFDGRMVCGTFPRMRLELAGRLGDSTCRALDVCDGQVLWSIRELIHAGGSAEPERTITRRDVEQVWRAERRSESALGLNAGLAAGGLSGLIAGLGMTFDLEEVRTDDGTRVLAGPIRPSADNEPGLKHAKTADRLPRSVRIAIDGRSLMPLRVTYYRPDGTPLSDITLSGYQLIQDSSPERFQYVPPRGAEIDDRTDELVRRGDASGSAAAVR